MDRRIHIAICDLQGQMRGKTLSREKFDSGCASGFAFPPIFPVTDLQDILRNVAAGEGVERLGDGVARFMPETLRRLPESPFGDMDFCLAEMQDEGAALDPRTLYRAVEGMALEQGLVPLQSIEYEFTRLAAGPGAGASADFAIGAESALYGSFGQLADNGFWSGLAALMQGLGIAIEAEHREFGPGSMEAVIRRSEGVRAADDAFLFKTFTKAYARSRGEAATFMARHTDRAPGNSGHVHISLLDRDHKPLFHSGDAGHGLSEVAGNFIGGLQRSLPELALLLLPNVNSYRRLTESAWSFDPRWCLWGIDNRTVPIRVMTGGADRTHIEVRIPGADANPYLVLAAVLGAGLRGIVERTAPTAPVTGNAFHGSRRQPVSLALPEDMRDAIRRIERSRLARDLFGETFVRVFAGTRRLQELEFRDAVSERELRRFFDLA